MILDSYFDNFLKNAQLCCPKLLHLPWGIACSGGGDSLTTAIMWKKIIDSYMRTYEAKPTIMHINHGVRKESYSERLWLQKHCEKNGWRFLHDTLSTNNFKQDTLRASRYQTLSAIAHQHNIKLIILGHHHDDQIITHAMRKNIQSTPHGLAGMSCLRFFNNLWWFRPILGLSKEVIEQFLSHHNVVTLNDPSNALSLRARWYQFLKKKPALKNNYTKKQHQYAIIRADNDRKFFHFAKKIYINRTSLWIPRQLIPELTPRWLWRTAACLMHYLPHYNKNLWSHTIDNCKKPKSINHVIICQRPHGLLLWPDKKTHLCPVSLKSKLLNDIFYI